MQVQLDQDSTNFSVPFLLDTQVVTIDSSELKKRIQDSIEESEIKIAAIKRAKEATKIKQAKAKEILTDTVAIDSATAKESYQVMEVSNEYLKIDSLKGLINFTESSKTTPYKKGTVHQKVDYESWQWIVIIIALGLIGATRAFNRKRFVEYIRAMFSRNASIQIIRNEKVYGHRANLFLTAAYFLSVSLLILHITDFAGLLPDEKHFQFYGLTLLVLLFAYFVKSISHQFIASILSFQDLVQEYNFAISLYNIAALFSIIPSILIASYGPSIYKELSLKIAIAFISLSIFSRIIRGVQIGINGHINIVYLFLYLCTLEILPLIIVFKILFI